MEITLIGKYALWMLAALFPAQILIGYMVAGKSSQSAKHYFIGGKELPLFLMFFLDFASVMGVGNFIGYAGKGYEIGLAQFWMMFGEQGTKVLFAVTVAGIAGRYAYTTLNEFMEQELYHDKWLRLFGGIAMTFTMMAWIGAQSIGLGTLIAVVMGLDPVLGIWIASVTAVVYTAVGGMWALVWTDVLQGIIRLAVGFIFFGTVWFGFDGVEGIKAGVMATDPQLWSLGNKGFLQNLAIFVTPTVGVFTLQVWWQRCFSAKDAKTAFRGFFYTAIFAMLMCSASIMMGMAAHSLNPGLARPDMAFGYLLTHWLNPVQAAALVVTIIGADMTVVAGFMSSAVTLILMDVAQPLAKEPISDRKLVRYARWLTFVVGCGSVWVAFNFPSVLSAGLWGYTFTGGGLFFPLVLGLLWKDRQGRTYITKNAAIASLLLGGTSAAVIQFVPGLFKLFGGGILPGLTLSLILTVGISLMERNGAKPEIMAK
ncbi:MAG: sodium:solute symporter family protein [Negativicutes bacterium]|nr:sodium:solute symporter family protein [Negativicutes bacterium]